jgi:hypothetical protein
MRLTKWCWLSAALRSVTAFSSWLAVRTSSVLRGPAR